MKVRITEIFYSLSGEGISQGVPTVFVRLAGCSLRCGLTENKRLWCDTGYSLSPSVGEFYSLEDAISEINSIADGKETQVLLTGGEPLEGDEKKIFCTSLAVSLRSMRHNKPFPIPRIETSGSISIIGLENMVFTLDYKLPNSGMEKYMVLENLHYLNERKNDLDEIKFVVRDKEDFLHSIKIIEKFKLETNLLFSPVADELSPSTLADWVKELGHPKSRLSLQLHKILWGNKRGV
ncbi:MAG: 7-carboxy-7-deazaguanine synthase QueE [Leptospiraceae bacterium]|nr:7-carboxy-7-deazaguanine synthase QueE [Leptospiraceae bacterium]